MAPLKAPLLDFMIVGAQKGGTTALAHFLAQHPAIGMARQKEVHLFDAPDFSPDWTPAQIDARYAPSFAHCSGAAIRGEATPIYLFLPAVAGRLKRYNPALKLIVLLRDPVERAISQHRMERARGNEHLPLWLALLSEPVRLRLPGDAGHRDSHLRRHSYRRRGLYTGQLRNLYRFFDRERVLIVRTEDLRQRHHLVLRRVFAFLRVADDILIAPRIVFAGKRGRRHRIAAWLLRLSYLAERVRSRSLVREPGSTSGPSCDTPG